MAVVIKKEEDELKGLEELYYGISDGTEEFYEHFPYSSPRANPAELTRTVECPICFNGDTYDSNEKLQTHLVSHISPEGKQHQFQCLFCLEKHATESVLAKHNQIMHPTETKTDGSPSYYCLICQQRHNSLHLLTAHLQKVHSTLELPYWCQSCSYRSSSHRDLVRHFYDDHKNQNFLQCPYCLDVSYSSILLHYCFSKELFFYFRSSILHIREKLINCASSTILCIWTSTLTSGNHRCVARSARSVSWRRAILSNTRSCTMSA